MLSAAQILKNRPFSGISTIQWVSWLSLWNSLSVQGRPQVNCSYPCVPTGALGMKMGMYSEIVGSWAGCQSMKESKVRFFFLVSCLLQVQGRKIPVGNLEILTVFYIEITSLYFICFHLPGDLWGKSQILAVQHEKIRTSISVWMKWKSERSLSSSWLNFGIDWEAKDLKKQKTLKISAVWYYVCSVCMNENL